MINCDPEDCRLEHNSMEASSSDQKNPYPAPMGILDEIIRVDSYALVTYIHGELGEFLYRLRQEIVPSCQLRSHVSLLPPRPLAGDEGSAIRLIERISERHPGFSVALNDIEVFPVTNVIYLSLQSGHEELTRIHGDLNRGSLAYAEPFSYHPHITLGQELDPANFSASLAHCRRRWEEYKGPRTFPVDTLTFVQNTANCGWLDLRDVQMEMAALPR